MIIRGHEKVLIQGITGKQGSFWSERMMEYGTQIVGGVNPKRAGETHLNRPVWGAAVDAAMDTAIDASVLFIPPLGVKAAALDAIEAGIAKLVILTEHVPVQDVMYVMAAAREAGTRIAGPNTAGLVTPGCHVGNDGNDGNDRAPIGPGRNEQGKGAAWRRRRARSSGSTSGPPTRWSR